MARSAENKSPDALAGTGAGGRTRRPSLKLVRLLQITVGGIAFGMKSTG